MALIKKYKLGQLLELCDERNAKSIYSIDDVKGISIQKVFIETKADMTGVSLKPYKLVKPDDFAYVTVTSRNGEKITLAHNDTENTYIVSSSYVVFRVKDKDHLLSEYLFMYFNRPEFDRYARFNSWGSARETFDWSEMCDIEIELPPKGIQQKYVDIYTAMLDNQRNYECGLEDLKKAVFSEIEKIKHTAKRVPVGKLLEEIDVRNSDGVIDNIQGINIDKVFMPSVADTSSVNKRNYKVVKKGQFAYSSMQTGRDECIRISLYDKEEPIIISPAYSVLQTKTEQVVAEYVMLWFMRPETDRYGWFASDSSVRANLDLDRFYEIELPLPEKNIQQAIANIYTAYVTRRDINECLKSQLKNMCPILIKGSLEESGN